MQLTKTRFAATLIVAALTTQVSVAQQRGPNGAFVQQGGFTGGVIQQGGFAGMQAVGFGMFGFTGGGCNGNIVPGGFGIQGGGIEAGGVKLGGIQAGGVQAGGIKVGNINMNGIQPGPFGFVPCGGPLAMLMQPHVQKDLKLANPQIDKLKTLQAKQLKLQQGLTKLTAQEQTQKLQDLIKSTDKAIQGILTKKQADRLKQIDLQLKGASALNDPIIATKLKITAAQKEKMAALQMEAVKDLSKLMTGFPGPTLDGQEMMKKLRAIQEQMEQQNKIVHKKIFEVLTAEQQSKWREITGEPFPPGPSSSSPRIDSPGRSTNPPGASEKKKTK